jgi:6-phosphogluconolactonase (cycloisomerase 2 family)
MQSKDIKSGNLQSILSRRNLLKGAGALAAAATVPEVFAQQIPPTGAPFGTIWLYISTYTSATPSAFGSNGQGIYLLQLDLFTGRLTILGVVAGVLTSPNTNSPSTIALDSTRTHLYAGNEYGPPGAVTAYSIERTTGALTLLNQQPTKGAPAHVSVDQNNKYLFSAEYSGGWFEVFPINPDGSLGPAVFQQSDPTNDKVQHAVDAPPGSFAISAHEVTSTGHPHMMQTDPSNQWVLGADAGQDLIYVWKLTQGAATPLSPNPGNSVSVPQNIPNSGDGPRHFAFHPNGKWMYSIQEEASTIIYWHFNAGTGALTQQQMISSLPPGFEGTDFTSEIRVSPDGRYVYGANRTNDTIGVFRIEADGSLSQVSHASTLGDYPRIFTIDPFGLYAVVGNQRADNVTTFKISGGRLIFTGNYTGIGSPSGMVFLY